MFNSIFLTTRNNGIYRKVTEICKNHSEKKSGKNYILNELKLRNIFKLNFEVIIFILKKIFNGQFFDDYKFLKIYYLNCELGRHSLSSTYNHLNSHLNVIVKNLYKLYYLYYGISLINYIEKYKKKIGATFIEHGVYINGVLINILSINKIPFYTNSYPKGLYLKNKFNKKISYENLIKISYPKSGSNLKIKKKNIFKWPWVFNKRFFKLKKNDLKNVDYVIYCHAFTDGLLANGYDGFIRMDDWLRFTLNKLLRKNNKILVKIHPNFHKFNDHFRSKYEIKIFNKIYEEFKIYKQIRFIDYPISNMELMKNLNNKKTILITHHGTPILESVANGFKIISSKNTHWSSNFKLSNTWQNKIEYEKILNKNFKQLKKGSNQDLRKLFSIIFNDPTGVHGNLYFIKQLSNQKYNKKLLEKIGLNIEEV